jgi:TorA maturation chaperone TorD
MSAKTVAEWQDITKVLGSLAGFLNQAPSEPQVLALALAISIDDPAGGAAPSYASMRQYFLETAELPPQQVTQQVTVDWTYAFRGVDKQRGPKPPFAGAWLAPDGLGLAVMQEVGSAYAAWGLRPAGESCNRPDYLGTQAEFCGFLAGRVVKGDANGAPALASFLDSYVLPWLPDYAQAAQAYAKTAFLRGFLDLLQATLRETHAAASRYVASDR